MAYWPLRHTSASMGRNRSGVASGQGVIDSCKDFVDRDFFVCINISKSARRNRHSGVKYHVDHSENFVNGDAAVAVAITAAGTTVVVALGAALDDELAGLAAPATDIRPALCRACTRRQWALLRRCRGPSRGLSRLYRCWRGRVGWSGRVGWRNQTHLDESTSSPGVESHSRRVAGDCSEYF